MAEGVAQRFSEAPALPDFSMGPIWMLVITAALAGLWWWWRKRFAPQLAGRTRESLQIEILATRSLGPRANLVIVESAGTRSLIATTAAGVHFLRDLPTGKPEEKEKGQDFAAELEKRGGELS